MKNDRIDKASPTIPEQDNAAKTPATGTGERATGIRKCMPLMALIAVILVAYGIIATVTYKDAANNRQTAIEADKSLMAAVTKDTKGAQGIQAGQLADGKTLEWFQSALKSAKGERGVTNQNDNGWNPVASHGAAGYYRDDSSKADKAREGLERAYGDLLKSRDEKTLADAKNNVKGAMDNGNATFSATDGQVANPAIRDALRTAINQADGVFKDPKSTVDSLNKAAQSVNDQIKAVNDSKAEKDAADAAAQQAAAEQAQQAAQAQSQSYAPSTQSYAPRAGSGYSSPAPSAPAAPAAPDRISGHHAIGGPFGPACTSDCPTIPGFQ